VLVPEVLQAPSIRRIVSGTLLNGIQLTGKGSGLTLDSVNIRGFVGGTWNIAGKIGPMFIIGAAASNWNATFDSPIPSFQALSDVTGTLTAPAMKGVMGGRPRTSRVETSESRVQPINAQVPAAIP